MKKQFVLTVAESKRLIAKGVAALPQVQRAMKEGIVAVAPGTTNGYVLQELWGEEFELARYRSGVTTPTGSGYVKLHPDLIPDVVFVKGKVDKELDRARDIVSSLLGLSRQTQTYTEPVNLNMVVTDALRILYNEYKHYDLEISENYDPDLPDIQGNFANLGQVVLNIIKNAIQAMGTSKDGKVRVSAFKNIENRVAILIQDNGAGIPSNIIDDIFIPFYTTKNNGSGIGLSLSRQIMRLHSGTITVSSIPNETTVFSLAF